MTREQKKLERKQRKAKIRAAQYAASAARKNQKGTGDVKRPVKINGYHSAVLMAKRNRKRAEAKIRQANWEKLSTKEKLIELKERRGESKKQLAKLIPNGANLAPEFKKTN